MRACDLVKRHVRRLIESGNRRPLAHTQPRDTACPAIPRTNQMLGDGTSWSPRPHLLGSLPDQLKCPTDGRRRVDELQFLRCEGGDQPLLIGSDQVRKRTPLKSGDDLIPLVDRVCAEVSESILAPRPCFPP